MVVFSLLEPISSLYHNGFTVIPCWSHCALPVCDIGPANLQVVGITVTVRKFRPSVLGTGRLPQFGRECAGPQWSLPWAQLKQKNKEKLNFVNEVLKS